MEFVWAESLVRLLDWRAPLEILLIGLGLYFLYRNLSAMGAWKIVVGILIGLGVFVLARLLGLKGIEWILSHFTGVALIALIVLFQPEIRRIFERAASFRRFGRGKQQPQLSALLADVLFDLARRKWGAIVVLPGEESLAAWTSTGIGLDATPSFPLLTSIFDPNSPGHDGAVVLDRGNVTSFGVRLPLSERGVLPEGLGTRHHAALGLSEATDALVLVVSEERGTVGAFVAGEHRPVGTRERLVEIVNAHWNRAPGLPAAPSSSRGGRVRTAPLLGSLVVATLFWFSIVPHGGEALEMSFSVPVEYTAPPSHLSVVGERVDGVQLLVSGEAADLSRVDPSLLRVRADLSGVEPGRQLVPLALGQVELPRGVRLVGIEPPGLDVEVLALVERELPVRPQLVGDPARGFGVEKVEVRPATLRVFLPGGEPDAPDAILTAPVQVSGLSASTRVISSVVAPSGIRPAGEKWPDVEVHVVIAPAEER